MADKALYNVKENGKHSAGIYTSGADNNEQETERFETLKSISKLFEERTVKSGAYRVGPEAFAQVYHYFMRYICRYSRSAYKMLITVKPGEHPDSDAMFHESVEVFADHLCKPLRRSDVVVLIRDNQFFLLFPDITEANLIKLAKRILDAWQTTSYAKYTSVSYETEVINGE